MKKVIAFALSAMLIIMSSVCNVIAADSKITFSDVDSNTSEGAAIYKLANAGVVNGYGNGTFVPDGKITRAELCKMINLVYKYTVADTLQFKDVTDKDWYASQVLIAKKSGYISGYEDGTFRGERNITRQEFCAIICRINDYYDLSESGIKVDIKDTVDNWAVKYVNTVVSNSVMKLEQGNIFRATEAITRSEVAVVLAPYVSVETTTPVIGGGSSGSGSSSNGSSGSGSSGSGSSGSGSSGGSSSGGSSSGGSSSGGSSSGGGSSNDDADEIKKENSTIITKLSSARASLNTNKSKYPGEQYLVIENVIAVLDKVIADESKYIINTGNVYAEYQDEILETLSMYEAWDDTTQSDFKNNIEAIDPDTFDFLCDFFGYEF